ncbi:MAG: ornithine cyclodeaminase family protein [Chloroflexi bacterium]|nr:ornithine cyclodeaminase family protein [Chloroflexota bacterium]
MSDLLLLTEAQAASLVTMQDALEAVEASLRHQAGAQATNLPRSRVVASPTASLSLMAGADDADGVMGVKAIVVIRGKLAFHTILFSTASPLLAVIESDILGQLRTGAATGVAARYMARPDTASAAVLGSGPHARTQLEALCAVRPVRRAWAYSPTAAHREAYAREMTARLSIPVLPVSSAEEAVQQGDAVLCATNVVQPVVRRAWLRPGAFVASIGAHYPWRQEVDETTVAEARVVVTDDLDQAKRDCGNILWAVERGVFRWEKVRTLADVVAGNVPGRTEANDITLFNSLGVTTWDLAVAKLAYQRALERGVGQRVALT